MEGILDIMQDVEKLILILTNIILAVLAIIGEWKSRKWKNTANFVSNRLMQEEKKNVENPKTKEVLVYASPKSLKTYMQKLAI